VVVRAVRRRRARTDRSGSDGGDGENGATVGIFRGRAAALSSGAFRIWGLYLMPATKLKSGRLLYIFEG